MVNHLHKSFRRWLITDKQQDFMDPELLLFEGQKHFAWGQWTVQKNHLSLLCHTVNLSAFSRENKPKIIIESLSDFHETSD